MTINIRPASARSADKQSATTSVKTGAKAVDKNATGSADLTNFASVLDGTHDANNRLLMKTAASMAPTRMPRDAPHSGERLHHRLLAQLGAADLLPAQTAAEPGKKAPPTTGPKVDGHHPDIEKRKTDLVALVTVPPAATAAAATGHANPQRMSGDRRLSMTSGVAHARGDVTLNHKAGSMRSATTTQTRAEASSGHPSSATPIAPRSTPPGSGRFAASTMQHDTHLLATFAKTKAKAPIGARKASTDASTSGGFMLATLGGAINHTGATTATGVAAAVTTTLAPTLQAPIGSVAWQQQLGSQLARLVQRGQQKMELHLHPRELGPLQISLQLSQGGAQAHFLAAHAQVRDAVQQAIPQLREALANQGIALGEAMVGQQQQHAQQQSMWAGGRQSTSAFGNRHGEPEAITGVRAPRTIQIPLHGNGVDLYA